MCEAALAIGVSDLGTLKNRIEPALWQRPIDPEVINPAFSALN